MIAALLLSTYTAGKIKRIPLDLSATLISNGTGTALDPASLSARDRFVIDRNVPLVRQAVEMGADINKANPTDDPRQYHEVVRIATGIPVLVRGGGRVADMEKRWSTMVGAEDFTVMCDTMQRLLDELNPDDSRA